MAAKAKKPSVSTDVEMRKIDDLLSHERNSNEHPAEQVAKLVKSIRAYGFTQPILVDEGGTILAGHGRAMAAAKLKLAEVPCIVARGWSDEQKRAYLIADNKIARESKPNRDLIVEELGALRELGVDMGTTGFDDLELGKLLDDDGPPGLPNDPETKRKVKTTKSLTCPHCGEEIRQEGTTTVVGD